MTAFCATCGGTLPEGANFCPHCGAKVLPPPAEESASPALDSPASAELVETPEAGEPKKDMLAPILFWVVGLFLVGLLITAVATSHRVPPQEPTVQETIPELANVVGPTETQTGGWAYSSRKDEVSGKQIASATLESSNRIQQGFPYGESGLSVSIRRHPRWGRDVYFTLQSGQLVCGVSDSCYATIRFDDGPARRVSLTEPTDHSSSTLFASGALAASIAKAKKMVVELQVYEAGNPQFLFDVSGLDRKRAGL